MNQAPEKWTVLSLLNWTKDYFARSGVDSPRLCAEVLLAHVLQCPRIELYARFDQEPSEEHKTAFRDLVKRAVGHEPVAYLVGRKEFYSLDFDVTPDVLIPRPETEMLVTEAINALALLDRPGTMWDACTGCGCVAVATATQQPQAMVLATDISQAAVAVSEKNAEKHNVADRVHCRVADLLILPDDSPLDPPFDVITANPPYIAKSDPIGESVKHEPATALFGGEDGLDFVRKLVSQAPDLIRTDGVLILEFGFQHADAVRDLVVQTGAFDEPDILEDIQQIERALVARRK